MSFAIGDKVRVNLRGASWNRKTATQTISTEMIDGAEGKVTQTMSFTGEAEHKVLTEFGEFKFWARDLEAVEPAEASEAEEPEQGEVEPEEEPETEETNGTAEQIQ